MKLKQSIRQIFETSNATSDDITGLQEKVRNQKNNLKNLQSKTKNNEDSLKALFEDIESDRAAVSELTQQYSNIVLISQNFLNASLGNKNATAIMSALNETMGNLQDSKIQNAIWSFNRTIQTAFSGHNEENEENFEKIEESLKQTMKTISEYMHRAMGYTLVPEVGYIKIDKTRTVSFRSLFTRTTM